MGISDFECDEEVNEIFATPNRNNPYSNITGETCFIKHNNDALWLFQYIEGPFDEVSQLANSIANNERIKQTKLIRGMDLSVRLFPEFAMKKLTKKEFSSALHSIKCRMSFQFNIEMISEQSADIVP